MAGFETFFTKYLPAIGRKAGQISFFVASRNTSMMDG